VQVSKRKLAIGAAVILASGIALMMLRPQTFTTGYITLHTFTDDASGLMDGTPVRLDGIRVGYLEEQKLTGSRDLRRKVELTLKVNSSYLSKIPADSVAGLAADNLLGDQYIAIHRGRAAQPITPDSEIAAVQAQDITKMMGTMSQEFEELQAIAARADKLLTSVNAGGGGALGKLKQDPTIKRGATVASELTALMNDVRHGHGTFTKLFSEDPLTGQLDAPMKRIDAVMADANGTSDKLKDFTQQMDAIGAEISALQDTVKAGKGTLGGFDEVQQRFGELSAKLAELEDRINSGQGTLGQVMVNPQLNEALAGTAREFQELARGLKTNPRKFISVKLF
jgi:phospholipid/cholesterol/gamma-HCH transport system substrate-binding protein